MQLPSHVKRVLLTGGAGFIGSHVLDLLAPSGVHFTVYDNLTNGKLDYIESHLSRPNVTFVKADILDRERLTEATRGHDLVWHLAANTDIINSHDQPSRDLDDCAVGTFNADRGHAQNGRARYHLRLQRRGLRQYLRRAIGDRRRRAALAGLDLRRRQDRERSLHLLVLPCLWPARLDVSISAMSLARA